MSNVYETYATIKDNTIHYGIKRIPFIGYEYGEGEYEFLCGDRNGIMSWKLASYDEDFNQTLFLSEEHACDTIRNYMQQELKENELIKNKKLLEQKVSEYKPKKFKDMEELIK